MNANFADLKSRVRSLSALLTSESGSILGHLEFAQALSQAQRMLRDGDRHRDPAPPLRAAVERAEALSRGLR